MSIVYLVPSALHETSLDCIPVYILDAVKNCTVIFAENERTTRRFLKAMDRSIVIDDFEWFTIHKAEEEQIRTFREKIKENKNIAILSEAGCPGIADPGQRLVKEAQALNCEVKPLVGPSSVLLALMASGMNGQHFEFVGYLPIESIEREKRIKSLEAESLKTGCTKIFIETPYRNQQLLETLLKKCDPATSLCIAANITAPNESVKTKRISEWNKLLPKLQKEPVIFLLSSGV